jgi:diguanylate cyclase (GGDEF)-like protein
VLERILAQIDRMIPHEVSSIMLIENDIARVVKSHSTLNPQRAQMLMGKSFDLTQTQHLRQMQATGQPYIIGNTQEHPTWISMPELSWIRSYMGFPIRVRGRVIGFINLDSTVPYFFNDQYIDALRAFAQQAGIALENAHLFNEQQKMAVETKRLYDLSTAILTPSSREQTAQTITETLRTAFRADAASILIFDTQGQPTFKYSVGLSELAYAEAMPRADGSTQRALSSGAPIILNGDQVHPRIRAEGFQTVIALPLKVDTGHLGVMYLNYRVPHNFDEHEIELLSIFANQAALALANTQLRESLREQATRDPVTGLFNRRYMEETLRRELYRAARHKSTVGVIMMDIDHFKDWNDRYGHSAGDLVLHEIGKVLQANVRTEDAACRYGGEELFIILPDASLDDTLRRAEDLRQQIKQIQLNLQGNVMEAITVSVGVALFPQHGSDANSLVTAVDGALYRAKNEGRDRVVAA